jgi:hypothetical protein
MDRSQGIGMNGNGARLDGHRSRLSAMQIEENIQHSRTEIDATLRAIQQKLRPVSIMREILGVPVSTDGTTVAGVLGALLSKSSNCAISHAGPTALFGMGTAWYCIQAFQRGNLPVGASGKTNEQAASVVKEKLIDAKDAAVGKITEATSATKEKIGQMAETSRDAVSNALDKSYEKGAAAAKTVTQGVRVGARWCRQTTNEYPAAMAAGMLAFGLIVGLVLPYSRMEDELVGETADRFKRRTKKKGHELLNVGSQVATQVIDKATDSLREEGIGARQLLDKIENVAHGTAATAVQAVQDATKDVRSENAIAAIE